MGFRERIGLKPKSSSANLSAGLNGGANGGYGFNAGPQQNMYSIPESGFASGPSQHQHQYNHHQPRTIGGGLGGIPMASRPGPQPTSFEANRSASSGSTYSFSTNSNAGTAGSNFGSSTTSFTTTSTGPTNNSSTGFGAGMRNFSGTSNKSNSTSKTAQQQAQYQQQDPQITAADVRRCTKLLRQMFELHLELWTLTYTHGTDQYRRHQKRMQVEAILVDIHNMVGAWNSMPPSTWTEEEYEEIKWIAQTLADLPPPPY